MFKIIARNAFNFRGIFMLVWKIKNGKLDYRKRKALRKFNSSLNHYMHAMMVMRSERANEWIRRRRIILTDSHSKSLKFNLKNFCFFFYHSALEINPFIACGSCWRLITLTLESKKYYLYHGQLSCL